MKDLMNEVQIGRKLDIKKDLSHEEKIAQSWTQDNNISFQEGAQFLALQASQNKFTINSKNSQSIIKYNDPQFLEGRQPY